MYIYYVTTLPKSEICWLCGLNQLSLWTWRKRAPHVLVKEWCVWCHFQQYFSNIVTVSFIGGGNRRTQRKPPTCCKSLTKLYHILLHGEHLSMSGIQTHNMLMLGVIIQVDNEKANILILTFSISSNLLGRVYFVVIVW
jgi:hypothetical protein